MTKALKNLLIVMALLVPVLLVGLGDRPVYKIQEVRIAETAREMVASGDYIVPRYNGELRLQKPPLPYWLTALAYRVSNVSGTATRLPAVLFGVLSALLLWMWVWRESGLRIAANCALIAVASYIGLRYFRSGEADAILLFFINLACIIGYRIMQDGTEDRFGGRRRFLFGLALGLGFLSKGPAGLAVPLLSLLALAVFGKKAGYTPSSIRRLFSVPGISVMLFVAFAWYAWISWRMPDIAQVFVAKQVDETFVSGNHAKPLWWYLAHWVEFFAPWGFLVIPAAWLAHRQRHQPTPPIVRFAWIWLAVVFVLLTATVNKQMQYALLFLPPLAILLGHYIELAKGRFAKMNRILFGFFCFAVVAGCVVALRKSDDVSHALLWLLIPLVPVLLTCVLRGSQVSRPVLLTAALTAMAFLYSDAHLSKEPHKVAAELLMAHAARYEPLYQMRGLADGALSFYAGRVVAPVDEAALAKSLQIHERVWVVGEHSPMLGEAVISVLDTADDLKLFQIERRDR